MEFNELFSTLAKSGATWVASENNISILSDDAKKKMLGAEKPVGYQPSSKKEMEASTFDLPSTIDWRNKNGNFVTPVKNQGGCGSCVAFGTMAAMESRFAIEQSMLLDFSEADMFFCSSHGAVCEGWWPTSAYQKNQERGIIQECLFPYYTAFPESNIWSHPPSCNNVLNRDNNAFIYTNINITTTVGEAKRYLCSTGPLVACFDVYEDFFHYHSGIYKHTTGNYAGGHCICIVGYNDNNGDGYWICKNSWDTSWGMDGYFHIAYGECNIDTYEKVAVSGITQPINVYVSIASKTFTNVFLRMDGTDVTQFTGSGAGVVNCQYSAGPWEQFVITKQASGNYTIESVQFPNVFLRMDGTGVTQPTGPGSGVVNCQYTADSWEQFVLSN